MYIKLSALCLMAAITISGCSKNTSGTSAPDEAASKLIDVTYNAPHGWQKQEANGVVSYVAEENNLTLAMVDVLNAPSAEIAAAIAWQTYDPSFKRKVFANSPRNTANGWDTIRVVDYLTSTIENKVVYARLFQLGQRWKVLLVDGDSGTYNKRLAAINELLQSFAVAGYQSEDLSGKTAKVLTEDDIKAFLTFIADSAKALHVPGVGMGISQNGKILYQGGVGLADVAAQTPVNADTLFMVASNTKGMTTLLLAKLVEMGKVKWDDRVIDHYPDFRLGDEATTESVLIEHLVCACTGLPRRDLGWLFNNELTTPATALFDDLATTAPTSAFGEIFQYSNEMAAAAGYVAGHILYPDMEIGAAYDKAMQKYIFDPLGMDSTTFSFEKALAVEHAKPYALNLKGQVEEIAQSLQGGFNHTVYAYRPAGAAWSSVRDMMHYVENELRQGKSAKGEQIFAAEPLLKRRQKYVTTGKSSYYGMGLFGETNAGIEFVRHGGSMGGYKSNFYALPEADVGLVILTNADAGRQMLDPSVRKLIELLYGGEDNAAGQVAVAAEQQFTYVKAMQNEVTYPGSDAIFNQLADHYVNDTLGELNVVREGGRVFMDPGVWRAELGTKVHEDGSVSIVAVDPALIGLELSIGNTDGKRTLSISYAQSNYTFTEQQF